MRVTPAVRTAIATAVLVAASLLAGGAVRSGEYALLDLRFAAAQILEAPEPPFPTAIVTITPESQERLGETFSAEWRRRYPAMIERLRNVGATAVVWDAIFVASNSEYDPDLATSFASMPVAAGEDRVDKNNEVIAAALARIGWINHVVSEDGTPRRTPADTPYPPLGFVAAQLADRDDESLSTSEHWIDFTFDPRDAPQFDIADVMLADANRLADEFSTPTSVFTDRVVFVGVDLPNEDRTRIPGSASASSPGVLAHVVAAWSFSDGRQIVRLDRWAGRGAAITPALLVLLAGGFARSRLRRLTLIAMLIGAALVPTALFVVWRLWVPYAATVGFTILAAAYVTVGQRISLARNYRTSLGFDPALLEEYNHSVKSLTEGVEREATVLCADVRSYTQFVTDNRPDEVQRVMTTYMAAMEELVDREGGYINKFVGDEIVAVFGFPMEEADAEHRATKCAHSMLERLIELNAEWSVDALPILEGIGVGVDSGGLRFTNIGGIRRIQFDIIGGAVNGASRLQGLTKQMARPLIVSAEVATAQRVYEVEQADPLSESESTAEQDASLVFIGEVMIRGQGRRRLFGIEEH